MTVDNPKTLSDFKTDFFKNKDVQIFLRKYKLQELDSKLNVGK